MKTLTELVQHVQRGDADKFEPDNYLTQQRVASKDVAFTAQYVLGNLYAKGMSYKHDMHFEIFKDHSNWQIWVWPYDTVKPHNNQYNSPYYRYEEVIEFIENNL